ncbi:ParA family protein [Chromobacterium vaccinii]|uniref:ParA family protein n=1 Tax=Chromobacterium vaccinii TaxID=1108595 RepID=A0ABV0FEY3_9NEIS
MITYSIWNNKGGTGKTSLTFQAVTRYAEKNPHKRLLVIDVCPQANLSELLLGGQQNGGSQNLLARQGLMPRCSIGGYFDARLPAPFSPPNFNAADYITKPNIYNQSVSQNIDLICGDPLLELQAIAMNTLANAALPGVNTWIGVIDWLKDFLDKVRGQYDMVFIDTNPSFSMYTQIAMACSDRVILPVMADDSSRRAIQNAFSLIYGQQLPSAVYAQYTFATKMNSAGRPLPRIHLIIKNRLTQYMGAASAYHAVLTGIDSDLYQLIQNYPNCFTFNIPADGLVDVRDFQTTGVVAFARGCPFSVMPTGRLTLGSHRVQVKPEYRDLALSAVDDVVAKL